MKIYDKKFTTNLKTLSFKSKLHITRVSNILWSCLRSARMKGIGRNEYIEKCFSHDASLTGEYTD